MNNLQKVDQESQSDEIPPNVFIEELSVLIGKKDTTIRSYATNKKQQHLIPPARKMLGSRRLYWLKSDVLAWLAAGSVVMPAGHIRRGRPTKKEAMLRARPPLFEGVGVNLTNDVIRGDIDTTYHTQQRDMFTSGLAAEIGVNAFAVWHAIKGHADFQTGVCWPGIRRLMTLTGLSTDPVQAGIKTLEEHHLLRVTRRGRKNIYVARERMDVRIGKRVICTVVIDFIPSAMKERLSRLKAASAGNLESDDVWAHVDLLPGPGLELHADSKTFKTCLRVDEVLNHEGLDLAAAAAAAAKRRAKQILEDSGRTRPERLPTK